MGLPVNICMDQLSLWNSLEIDVGIKWQNILRLWKISTYGRTSCLVGNKKKVKSTKHKDPAHFSKLLASFRNKWLQKLWDKWLPHAPAVCLVGGLPVLAVSAQSFWVAGTVEKVACCLSKLRCHQQAPVQHSSAFYRSIFLTEISSIWKSLADFIR